MMIGDNNYIGSSFFCNCTMPEDLKNKMEIKDDNVYYIFSSALEGGNQLEPPSEYVTVLR